MIPSVVHRFFLFIERKIVGVVQLSFCVATTPNLFIFIFILKLFFRFAHCHVDCYAWSLTVFQIKYKKKKKTKNNKGMIMDYTTQSFPHPTPHPPESSPPLRAHYHCRYCSFYVKAKKKKK